MAYTAEEAEVYPGFEYVVEVNATPLLSMLGDVTPHSLDHSMRVGSYVNRLCGFLELPEDQTKKLTIGGYLHDVGKMDPKIAELVDKPGSLDSEERRIVGSHTTVGKDIIHRFLSGKYPDDLVETCEDLTQHHHDPFPGANDPVRLLILSDRYDVITGPRRPYQKDTPPRVPQTNSDILFEHELASGVEPKVYGVEIEMLLKFLKEDKNRLALVA